MFRGIVSAALFVAIAGVSVAQARTISQIGGPKELPPPGFKGQMFVDSRGCVFLRAGVGGVTNWVPRVSRDRKALCGYPPTMATLGKPVPVAPEAPQVAEAPAPVSSVSAQLAPAPQQVTSRPVAAGTSFTTPPVRAAAPAPALRSVAAPAPVAQPALPVAVADGGSRGRIGCFTSAPVAQVVTLSNGGRAVLCTQGDGTTTNARAPIYPTAAAGDGQRVGAGLYPRAMRAASRGSVTSGGPAPARQVAAVEGMMMPPGYKPAWTDDRLNPYRGVGTAQGQAAQDQIWTRDIPAQLVSAATPGQRYVAAADVTVSGKEPGKQRVQVSTMSDPAQPVRQKQAASGRFFVQVGTFGELGNAEGAKARLRAAGLPVGTSTLTRRGKAMQIVLAGPFDDAASAQSALRAARGAGFRDAFLR
ncbi:MAG: SPOR domain-containing protein [Gemmobacter sp.]|jgi:cell division septation protein DedD|nr:SPOR domain-containing protein [Gemmobacter sp.]